MEMYFSDYLEEKKRINIDLKNLYYFLIKKRINYNVTTIIDGFNYLIKLYKGGPMRHAIGDPKCNHRHDMNAMVLLFY
jgi:hypothetical protein